MRGTNTFVILQTFYAPVAGNYLFIAAGGQGGSNNGLAVVGGLGATVEATVFLESGAVVPIIVAAQGGAALTDSLGGAGGGGLSAVYINGANALPTIVAGLPPYCLSYKAQRGCQNLGKQSFVSVLVWIH